MWEDFMKMPRKGPFELIELGGEMLTMTKGLRPTSKPHRYNIPNRRRLPEPLLPLIHHQQRPLRRLDRREILIPHHTCNPLRSSKSSAIEYSEAKDNGRRSEAVCGQIHGVKGQF
jgi:hypothetical protein